MIGAPGMVAARLAVARRRARACIVLGAGSDGQRDDGKGCL